MALGKLHSAEVEGGEAVDLDQPSCSRPPLHKVIYQLSPTVPWSLRPCRLTSSMGPWCMVLWRFPYQLGLIPPGAYPAASRGHAAPNTVPTGDSSTPGLCQDNISTSIKDIAKKRRASGGQEEGKRKVERRA